MKDLTFTLINKDREYGKLDPIVSSDRMGDDGLNSAIREKWEASEDDFPSGNGNIKSDTYFDGEKVVFVSYLNRIAEKWHKRSELLQRWDNIISSHLLLYRLICLFNTAPDCDPDPYKCVWTMSIVHKPTGKRIAFGEHKACPSFWLPEADFAKLDPAFSEDLRELLAFLISDQLAHPYDGVTAGQIA